MYRIIGGDGREYGPVSDAQVRAWVAEGRANADTRAIEPGGEWRPLSAFAEFADLFAAGAPSGAFTGDPPSATRSGAWVEESKTGAPHAAHGSEGGAAPPAPDSPEDFRRVPNLLVPAILCTICCCMPAGIVAIVKAAQANARVAAGDRAGARKAADEAHFWCWLSFAIGIVVTLIYIIFLVKSGNWGQT